MDVDYFTTLAVQEQFPQWIKGLYLKGCPYPRIALIGRSNVGKSSLLNAILGSKLARVSKTPGKTRAIHFFKWNSAQLVVADLPGYGFAKVGNSEHEQWSALIQAYFKADPALGILMVLLDARHGPTKVDEEALAFLTSLGVPFWVVMTKSDEIRTQKERQARKKEIEACFQGDRIFWVSSKEKTGIQDLIKALLRYSEEVRVSRGENTAGG